MRCSEEVTQLTDALSRQSFLELVKQMGEGRVRRRGTFTDSEIKLILQVDAAGFREKSRTSVLAQFRERVQLSIRREEAIPSFLSFLNESEFSSRRTRRALRYAAKIEIAKHGR